MNIYKSIYDFRVYRKGQTAQRGGLININVYRVKLNKVW